MEEKTCSRCKQSYPLTTEYFYPARKIDRRKIGWQSYCKSCWKDINLANKNRRREEYGSANNTKSRRLISQYFSTVSQIS